MRLTDLKPQWVNYVDKSSFSRFTDSHSRIEYDPDEVAEGYHDQSEDFARADGVLFLCPTCFKINNGPVGAESVLCWFANRSNVPADALPGPGRWSATGTAFDDLTLSPSVDMNKGHWHGYVTNGEVT